MGDFSGLKAWLSEKIHSQGKRYSASDLVKVITGNPLSHKPLMDYLDKKFGPLYL
jgi:carboxypeptidase Taq